MWNERDYNFDRDKFRSEIDSISSGIIENKYFGFPYFTYIAVSDDGDVYKIGRSRNPIKREGTMKGGYRHFKFKMVYYIALNIEYELLAAIVRAGAKTPLPSASRGRREVYYLTKEDIDYIVQKCGFKPIQEFEEYKKMSYWDLMQIVNRR